MADAYLNLAEKVLLDYRRPLRPLEITYTILARYLLPWHLYALAPHKMVHARIGEDIAANATLSRFFMAGPGTFFLRSLLKDPLIQDAYKEPYDKPSRRRELRRERILSLDRVESDWGASRDPFVVSVDPWPFFRDAG